MISITSIDIYPSSYPRKRAPKYSVKALYFNEDGEEGAYIFECKRDGQMIDILSAKYDLLRRKVERIVVAYALRKAYYDRIGEPYDVAVRWDTFY